MATDVATLPMMPKEVAAAELPEEAFARVGNQYLSKAATLAWLKATEGRFSRKAKATDDSPGRMHAAYDQAEACAKLYARLEKQDAAKAKKVIDVCKELAVIRSVLVDEE